MKSFELAAEQWRTVARRLQDGLQDVDRRQRRFAQVERKLERTARALRESEVWPLLAPRTRAHASSEDALSQTEAHSFATRHSGEPSSAVYSAVANRIAQDHGRIELSNGWLCEVHREVAGRDALEPGEWKKKGNFFAISRGDEIWFSSYRTAEPEQVPRYMEELNRRFTLAWHEGEVHRLLLLAAYWFEVVAIHPFADANGRVSRLAALLLLWQSGHRVAKYASLEGAVAQRRQAYLEALHSSLRRWEEAQHDPEPWCAFVIEIVVGLYAETERRVQAATSLVELAEQIFEAIEEAPEAFHLQDLAAALPADTDEITGVLLNRLREAGRLRAVREGNAVRWEKTHRPG